MRRSEWSVWLVTYQGAFVIVRRSFDWYRCITDIFDLLAQPQSAMPYVHMGFSTVLYISSLFSSERGEFFPISQFISLFFWDQVVSFFWWCVPSMLTCCRGAVPGILLQNMWIRICTCSAGRAVQYQRRTVLRTQLMFLRRQNWHTNCAGVFFFYVRIWSAQWGREDKRSGKEGSGVRSEEGNV